jgi:hypothetical protein
LKDDVEGVRPHLAVGQIGLGDHGGLLRLGHVHRRDVLRRRLVGEPQHAAAVPGELDGHALAAVAEAVQLVVGQELHVAR